MNINVISHEDFRELLNKVDAINQKLDRINGGGELSKQVYTINETCELLSVSKRTLQRYRDNGLLGFSQVNNKIMFQRDEIEKFLARNKVDATFSNYKIRQHIKFLLP